MRYLIGFVLALSFALPVAAQDFQKDLDAYSRGDYATALHEWRPLAEQGVTVAQFELGLMYENGQGVQQDYSEAKKWYRKAAEQGHAGAQVFLGMVYYRGQGAKGIRQDYVEAAKSFHKAAEQGIPNIQAQLGFMYEHGQGVQQDCVMAYMWYDLAALGGFKQVLPGQGRMGMKMTSVDISEAKRLAREWLRMHGKTP